ncbi:DUF362 domain-containing protein [Sporomusa aerivorans]|uniref:DUF362 domain-containing protein n=1 Tax=Sporomusa aerivorans TaxID=204936 RepID=UPI00352B230F
MKNKEIHVIYGRQPEKMVYEVLEKMDVAKALTPEMTVGLKPNLVVAREAASGATTTPEIVEGVIRYLQDHGIKKIAILEGSWVGDSTKKAFEICGYKDLARRYQIGLYDLKDDSFVVVKVGDLDIKVCKRITELDYLINMPVLKAHCQTLMTCALKNLKGCIPDSEKRRFHSLGLTKPIGYLGKAVVPDLTIVDGLNGDLTFEEGGNPVEMARIIVGYDPVLIDAYAAELLGYRIEEIKYIPVAASLGVGSADLASAELFEYDMGYKKAGQFKPSGKAQRLAQKVEAREACSACYGTLIHSLQRLADNGTLGRLKQKIYIGQGMRGQNLTGLGIGNCTKSCSTYIPGCPPKGKDIVAFLEENL